MIPSRLYNAVAALVVLVAGQLRCLLRRRDGNVAVLFALAAIPVIVGAGIAIDLARTYSVKVRLGAALDAAALAVGSQFNQTSTQLSTALQNYFTANYPSSALGNNVTVSTDPANADMTASVVTYKASATVPLLFMPLVGIDNTTVTVTAQTQKTTGIEVALVLDNTGSMLCGPNDGYDSDCSVGVVASDTTCSVSSNQSRICTLINASKTFVNTLTSAISTSGQLYIAVVPYVTTVNVGGQFCTSSTSCSHMVTDACSGDFLDYKGHPIYHAETSRTFTAHLSNGSAIISSVSSFTGLSVGSVVTATGIPSDTTIKSMNVGARTITLCKNATQNANVTLTAYAPVKYDTTNTNTTSEWMGCVVEPTSADENASGSSAMASATTDPDYTEPAAGWPSWYAYWWAPDSANSWTSTTIQAQSTATESQGLVLTDWLKFDGPNEGCPSPMLPLTDATTTSGKTAVLNAIGNMWPRDAGGTQVHIGMIWGWRVLSPYGPFASSGGHPLDYSTQTNTNWKKIIVLMTDGQEEWPATDNMTGLGQIADGKIGTTSTTTAVTNLDTRLANVCNNMAATGNYVIYTIGLGNAGSTNAQLQACPGNTGGFFEAATPTNLQKVFDDIAKSMLSLQLTR